MWVPQAVAVAAPAAESVHRWAQEAAGAPRGISASRVAALRAMLHQLPVLVAPQVQQGRAMVVRFEDVQQAV